MTKIHCQSCFNHFEAPVQNPGRISYVQCKNVFRVSFNFRTSCPFCKKILQLTPISPNSALGLVVDNYRSDEKTENSSIPIPVNNDENTLPKKNILNDSKSFPTIRIKTEHSPTNVCSQSPTTVQPFRFADQNKKISEPKHLTIKSRSTMNFSILKMFLSSIMILGLGLTIIFLKTAIFSDEKETGINPISSKVSEQEQKTKHSSSSRPLGGPQESMNQFHSTKINDSINDQLVSLTISSETKLEQIALLELPDLKNLTSIFGLRIDPFDKTKLDFHGGIDFRASYNSEVKAALDGVIRFVGRKGNYGKVVMIRHSDVYETRYGHLSKYLVSANEKVKKGDIIGLVGTTGRTTGPHIHFELLKYEKKIDPLREKLNFSDISID